MCENADAVDVRRRLRLRDDHGAEQGHHEDERVLYHFSLLGSRCGWT